MKQDSIYVVAVLKYIADVERFVSDYPNLDAALADYRNYMAVLRVLQIMAETTQRISDTTKNVLPEIDWAAIAGFRNVLVHDYLGDIDPAIIASVIIKELPHLKHHLQTLGYSK